MPEAWVGRHTDGSGGVQVRRRDMLGAPGRARAAHIMQFRPMGVERPGEEVAPEGTELGERVGGVAAAGGKMF